MARHPPTQPSPDGAQHAPGRQAPPAQRVATLAPRRRALTREEVLATALELIDRHGVEELSMRRLGHALDRDPMRLYRHAPNKAALLDGVAELVLSELAAPAGEDGDWEQALRSTARSFRALARRHPQVVPLLVTRPLSTPLGLRPAGTLRPLENILDLLIRAGFSECAALHAYRLFFGYLNGHVLDELQELVDNAEETDALLRLGLHRLSAREFPRLRAVADLLVDYDGAAELDRGLDVILAGLRSLLPAGDVPVPRPPGH